MPIYEGANQTEHTGSSRTVWMVWLGLSFFSGVFGLLVCGQISKKLSTFLFVFYSEFHFRLGLHLKVKQPLIKRFSFLV